MSKFMINNIDDFIEKISKWNITSKKYPDNISKNSIEPLKQDYKSIIEYRKVMEPLFYLECWEQFRKFCNSIRDKRLNIKEKAVEVTISNFEVTEIENNSGNSNSNKNKDNQLLSKGVFEILMPNYFICGYEGIEFSKRNKYDALERTERRASGNIRKTDLIYLARVSSDFEKTYYKTVVMADFDIDNEKNLISIPSRRDLNNVTAVLCTKKMTEKEIKELKDELKNKNNNSLWICIHALTLGTDKKIFNTLETLTSTPNLKICKEIISGKCRNTIYVEEDDSEIIRETIKRESDIDDYWLSIIIKIYLNSGLNKDDYSKLLELLEPKDNEKEDQSPKLDKNIYFLIENIKQEKFLPFTLVEQKILYEHIFESQGQNLNSNNKLKNLLLKDGNRVNLNKTINEIIVQYGLNITQATILAKIKQKEKFLSLIKGPPGTGKTKMITSFIYQELREARLKNKKNKSKINSKILVCAPSNTACNEIARRLKRENVNTIIKTVRFAPEEQVDNAISHIIVDKVAARKLYSNITKNSEFFNVASSFNVPEGILKKLKNHHNNIQSKTLELTLQKKVLIHLKLKNTNKRVIDKIYENICLMENDLDYLIQIFIDNVLLIDEPSFNEYKQYMINIANDCKQKAFDEADVIVTTLTSSSNKFIRKYKNQFSLLIVDEASQATELVTLIPFCYNIPKAVLIGDSNQLPPTINNEEILQYNYDRSLFQRLESNSPDSVHLLNIQYRMHPMISKLSSQCFYSDKIINSDIVQSKKWEKNWYKDNSEFGPLMFFNVKGSTNNDNASLNNMREANRIMDFLIDFLKSPETIHYNCRISIISPYRGQVNLIRYRVKDYYKKKLREFNSAIDIEEFRKLNLNDKLKKLNLKGDDDTSKKNNKNILKRFDILDNINVNTVDSYQGQESDIVILSCVRSNTRTLGFLKDKRRLNVSITRARYTLIIFGDSDTLCKDKEWKRIIDEIKKINRFKTIN